MTQSDKKRLTDLPAWEALKKQYDNIKDARMADWFTEDAERFDRLSLQIDGMLFDYSKNRVTDQTLSLLRRLAEESGLHEAIENMFSGQPINFTENRAVLHTALRLPVTESLTLNGDGISDKVEALHTQMQAFTDAVRSGEWRGTTGKSIRDIVNIGIGGSDLGPKMVVNALQAYATTDLRCFFISDINNHDIDRVLQNVDPERVLFIISSKSFSTPETLSNADFVRRWLMKKLCNQNINAHFVAVTSAFEKAHAVGIPRSQIFPLWDWVGGRYSVWSAIGLPIALMIGMPQFCAFLSGAHQMDRHFRETDFAHNIPVMMALLGIWNINFLGAPAHVIAPYMGELKYFRDHIQQIDMESNGKRVTESGVVVEYATGPVILGESGCDSQHSFFQLLHQGPAIIPVDFIVQAYCEGDVTHHAMLMGSAFSQAKALMQGKSETEAYSALLKQGIPNSHATVLAKHQALPGNRPSNVFLIDRLTPERLGSLIAMYEHKVFVQGIIWQINSFDQWGVELGKKLLPDILHSLQRVSDLSEQDGSTQGLIQHVHRLQSL